MRIYAAINLVALLATLLAGCDSKGDGAKETDAKAETKKGDSKKDTGDTKEAKAPERDPAEVVDEMLAEDTKRARRKKVQAELVALGDKAVPALTEAAIAMAKDYEKAQGGTKPGQKAHIARRRATPIIEAAIALGKPGDAVLEAIAKHSKDVATMEICLKNGRQDICK